MELLLSLVLVLVTLFTSTQAQTDTAIPCCTVPVNNVPQTTRSDWCSAQLNVCSTLCGGSTAANGNTCSSATLIFSCRCSDDTDISSSVSAYQQSVPGLMCRYWFDACINATGSNASAQFQCMSARDTNCGNKTATVIHTAINSISSQASSLPSLGSLTQTQVSQRTSINTLSTSSISSTSEGIASATNTASSQNSPGTKKAGLSGGAITGIVIGTLGGISVLVFGLFFCVKRQKRNTAGVLAPGKTGLAYDEKQVISPTAADISAKPELQGSAVYEVPEPVDHNGFVRPFTHQAGVQELQSPPYHNPSELYASEPYRSQELYGAGYHDTAELHAPTPRLEMKGTPPAHSTAPSSAPAYEYQPQPHAEPHQSQPPPNSYPKSPEPPVVPPLQPHSTGSDEIAALEEEERRIDAEMEEVRRMKELRDQKHAIQQKLRDAKGR